MSPINLAIFVVTSDVPVSSSDVRSNRDIRCSCFVDSRVEERRMLLVHESLLSHHDGIFFERNSFLDRSETPSLGKTGSVVHG